MKIHIGTDHAGFEFKQEFVEWLKSEGHEVEDHGAHELDPADNYPDFVVPAAKAVAHEPGSFGVVIGGSGYGEAMAANRITGVRAAVFYGPRAAVAAVDATGRKSEDEYELIKLTRLHNNANVLSFGLRFITMLEAQKAVSVFLSTEFEGGRHQKRIDLIEELTK